MMPLIFALILGDTNMPQIPFSVVDPVLNKTVHVKASCDLDEHSMVLYFDSSTATIGAMTFVAIKKVFDTEGLTIVKICRKID